MVRETSVLQTYIEYTNGHKGPESELLIDRDAHSFPTGADLRDGRLAFFGFTNFKYFNGRFFFNAEVGFYHEFFRQSGLGCEFATDPNLPAPNSLLGIVGRRDRVRRDGRSGKD